MSAVDKDGAAEVLEQVAALLELKGENAFRVRAFRGAARAVSALPGTVAEAIADGSLASAKGIGPATRQLVEELVATGRSTLLEELRGQVAPGLVEMLQLPGLGVAKVRQIHETLHIETIAELEAAVRDGSLAALPRFGAKTAANILASIEFLRRSSAFRLCHHAAAEAASLAATLAALPGVERVVTAGDVRRRMEVVNGLNFVVIGDTPPAEFFRRLAAIPGIVEFSGHDERRVTLRQGAGSVAQVIVTTPKNAGAVLVRATGSEAHVAALEAHARETGHTLDGAALWHGSTFVPTPDEATFYRALGLDEIPPELREGAGEVAAARDGALPALVTRADLRGFLHCHSNWSDGTTPIEELARACQAAGYAYVGLTDHSQAAAYAGGLKPDALQRQADEIDAVNTRLNGIRVLKGIEADILADGALDYPAAVLDRLDFVVGSVHSRFQMGRDEMTARMLRALDDPHLTIVGHPTGRLLLAREAYAVDLDALIEKAASVGAAIEINADPHRLDLDWRVLRAARARGLAISIGADAHDVGGIGNMEWGIGIARKGWLTAGDILNTRSVEEFLAFARKRRGA
ncbi:MAG TPA: DNA polymerase/3'-5' exonuclease PolX [Gemmatimonadales bacterium]|nr:DNA polymerase/3'-5' exonuclease PolX [Gemmatimonadales bacterium]